MRNYKKGFIVAPIIALIALGILAVGIIYTRNNTTKNQIVGSGGGTVIGNAVVNLVGGVTGVLPVSNGGTAASTLTGLLQGNGTAAVTAVTGTIGQFPYFNGTNTLLATSSVSLSTANRLSIVAATIGSVIGASGTDAALDVFGTTNAIIHAQNTGAQSTTAGAAIIGYAVPTSAAMSSGNRLASFVGGGSLDTSSTLYNATAVQSFATENWSGTSGGSKLDFQTTPNTTLTRGTALTLDQNKVATFAATAHGGGITTADSATITMDWSKGNTQEVVLGATGRTLAFSNVTPYTSMKLWVWQDATGSRTITTYPAGVHWAGGTPPTLTATANKFDLLVFTTASSTTQFSAGASLNY